MLPPRFGLFLAALWTVLVTAGPTLADDPRPAPKREDPEARKLLDAVISAYRRLNGYADQGRFTFRALVNGQERKQGSTMALAFAQPNKINLEVGAIRLVSDGKNLITLIGPLKKYTEVPAPSKITLDILREGPIGAMLFGGASVLTEGVLLSLLLADEPARVILEGTDGITMEADRELDGKTAKSLLVDQSSGPDFRMLVDPESHLLLGIDLVPDPKELAAGVPQGTTIEVKEFGWRPGAIRSQAPEAQAFAFEPPAGFQKVESVAEALAAAARQGGDDDQVGKELLGKPAPEFNMVVLAGEGQMKRVSKDDLAGNVVLIDFWATWCGPCLRELPEVQKMVEALAREKKEVRVIALSIDENPGEIAQMRKLVETTLKEKQIDFGGNEVGLVALDTTGAMARAFNVSSIPMIVLLDRQGIVQKVHLGYTEREVLEQEIQDLLDGKSLLQAEAKKERPKPDR
ncbi:MAG: TlpA family protein disulfide reductase [Isosphaeraceae bacterium]|nr:TlpA family protein disulfide reductase [Isosphaeraceae bacterium]